MIIRKAFLRVAPNSYVKGVCIGMLEAYVGSGKPGESIALVVDPFGQITEYFTSSILISYEKEELPK